MRKRFAFTLAEVLITLTIIGVIASITIPNLSRKWRDHADVQKVKEAHSLLSNAFKMAIAEYGELNDWNWPSNENWKGVNAELVGSRIKDYLKVKTYCGNNFPDNKCTPNGGEGFVTSLAGEGNAGRFAFTTAGRMTLANGMFIGFKQDFTRGTQNNGWTGAANRWINGYSGYVVVDINGKGKPNRIGYDIFYLPYCTNGMNILDPKKVSTNVTSVNNPTNCSNKNSDGVSCGEWVLLHGNMDYKYRDVSAEW